MHVRVCVIAAVEQAAHLLRLRITHNYVYVYIYVAIYLDMCM